MSYLNDHLATRAIKARLEPLFAADGEYGAAIVDSNSGEASGADVVLAIDEDTEEERVGKPYLLITEPTSELSPWSGTEGNYRQVAVIVSACANDFSGAQAGAANPVTSIEQMSRYLQEDIDQNYSEWKALGLESIDILPQAKVTVKETDESPGAVVLPHRITFHYHRA